MLGKLRGAIQTLRVWGVGPTLRETLRRIAGIQYTYRGIVVKDARTFRTLKKLSLNGKWEVIGNEVVFMNKLGKFAVPIDLINALHDLVAEDFTTLYGYLNVKGKRVADVGGFLGETAVLFAWSGAKHIDVYEPIYYHIIRRNLELNGVYNATVYPYGVSLEDDVLYIAQGTECYACAGLRLGRMEIQTKNITSVLASVEVVKMDCEGCEWSLLAVPCWKLQTVDEFAIEIHGPVPLLVRKMEKCGFVARHVSDVNSLISMWYFKREE